MSPIAAGAFGETGGSDAAEEAKPKKRRTKRELIDAAEIPSNDQTVEVKFKATNTVGERKWPDAVALFDEGKAEFVDKTLKYAVLKMRETEAGKGGASSPPADDKNPGLVSGQLDIHEKRWVELQALIDEEQGEQAIRDLSAESEMIREEIIKLGGQDPASDEAYERRGKGEPQSSLSIKPPNKFPFPEAAEIGDEVVINGATSYIGHGHITTNASPHDDSGAIQANGRWTLADNGWSYTDLKSRRTAEHAAQEGFFDPGADKIDEGDRSIAQAASKAAGITKSGEKNAQGDLVIQREAVGQGAELVDVNLGLWKVSMGYLEKIGLPDYSSLQIGPASAQRHVLDDGRRIVVAMHGREVEIPAAVVEGMQEAAQVSEYVMRAERQAMINFLEAVKPGSTKSA